MTRFAAILSGGVGERFWPASTPERPKQLLPLLGPRSMLRETLERVAPELPPERILIVTSAALAPVVERECPEVPPENVLGEPRGRNTAPAVAVAACAAIQHGGPQASLAILPADHLVRDPAGFLGALRLAFAAAEARPLIVTLGVEPDRPETGYGYITRGEAIGDGVYRIEAFHEKPDEPAARALVAGGRSSWNAGMFIARASTFAEEIRRHAPQVAASMEPLLAAGSDAERERAFRELYERVPSVAFDVAVMERTGAGAVLPVDVGWDDVGSWEAVARFLERDADGNVVRGAGRLIEARDNILFSEDGRITVVGASDLVVVRSGAETFVCGRDRLPQIKELLRSLDTRAPAGVSKAARGGKAAPEGKAARGGMDA